VSNRATVTSGKGTVVHTVRSTFISNSFAVYVPIFHDDDDDDDDDDISINIRETFLSEICALLIFCAAYTGSFLTTFRKNYGSHI